MSNSADGKFSTPYGAVKMSYPGPFKRYENVTYQKRVGNSDYVQDPALTDLILQGPALRSFRDAERATTPRRLRSKGKIRPILITGFGGRDYALQRELYEAEPGRFADPDTSMHVEFLAVDIHSGQSLVRRAQIKRALKRRGWHYAVSGEPWHASFRLPG